MPTAKKTSSRKKPTKKAGTPSRSTTSSTTAASVRTKLASGRCKPAGHIDQPETPEPSEPLQPLSALEQSAVLELLFRGASPAGASAQVGVSIEAFFQTVANDPAFRAKVREIAGVLSGNVQAVLYRTAMEGNVSAQQAFLKLFPPPSFEPAALAEPQTFDDLLDDLSDAELVELARAVGVDLPHEIEANLDAANVSYLTERISRRFAIDRRG